MPRAASSTHRQVAATWQLYVLRCGDGTLYCGITNDLKRRFAQHQTGKGARYTRGRGPLHLLRSWPAASHSSALKAEHAFKRLDRSSKEAKLKRLARNDPLRRVLRGSDEEIESPINSYA